MSLAMGTSCMIDGMEACEGMCLACLVGLGSGRVVGEYTFGNMYIGAFCKFVLVC